MENTNKTGNDNNDSIESQNGNLGLELEDNGETKDIVILFEEQLTKIINNLNAE